VVARKAPEAVSRRLSILTVDDNEDVTMVLKAMLEHLGHDVLSALDGEAALAQLDGFKPDLALLDIGLPGMDGYELARAIRSKLGARPVLVALSGYGQQRDRQRSREAGFDLHLVKPLSPEELRALLDKVARSALRPAAPPPDQLVSSMPVEAPEHRDGPLT
jgi:CheY-like chemotaxis protein